MTSGDVMYQRLLKIKGWLVWQKMRSEARIEMQEYERITGCTNYKRNPANPQYQVRRKAKRRRRQ